MSADKTAVAVGQSVTLTASFIDRNDFASAQDVRLSPALPGGMTAEPLGPVTTGSVAPGETFTARWKVTLNTALDHVVAALPVPRCWAESRRAVVRCLPKPATVPPRLLRVADTPV